MPRRQTAEAPTRRGVPIHGESTSALRRLQQSAGNRAVVRLLGHGRPAPEDARPAAVDEVLRTSGDPLDHGTRRDMEDRFQQDFSAVRVHADARAATSAEAVDARAYTVGQRVVFGKDQYAPRSGSGRHLLAHELAHVVQQRRGGAAPRGDHGASLEVFATQAARAAVQGNGPVAVAGASAAGVTREPAASSGAAILRITDLGSGRQEARVNGVLVLKIQRAEPTSKLAIALVQPAERKLQLNIQRDSTVDVRVVPEGLARLAGRGFDVSIPDRAPAARHLGELSLNLGEPASPPFVKTPPKPSAPIGKAEPPKTVSQGPTNVTVVPPSPAVAIAAASGASNAADVLGEIAKTPGHEAGPVLDALNADHSKRLRDAQSGLSTNDSLKLGLSLLDLSARRTDRRIYSPVDVPRLNLDFGEAFKDAPRDPHEVQWVGSANFQPSWTRGLRYWKDASGNTNILSPELGLATWDASGKRLGLAPPGADATDRAVRGATYLAQTGGKRFVEGKGWLDQAAWNAYLQERANTLGAEASRKYERLKGGTEAWTATQRGAARVPSAAAHLLGGRSREAPGRILARNAQEIDIGKNDILQANTPEDLAEAERYLTGVGRFGDYQFDQYKEDVFAGGDRTITSIKVGAAAGTFVLTAPVLFTSAGAAVGLKSVAIGAGAGALVSGTRQGVEISQGTRTEFDPLDVAKGAIVGGGLVYAPGLAPLLVGAGTASATDELTQGHYKTAAFDFATAALPVAAKGGPGLAKWARPRVLALTLRFGSGLETGLGGRSTFGGGLSSRPNIVLTDLAGRSAGVVSQVGTTAAPGAEAATPGATAQTPGIWKTVAPPTGQLPTPQTPLVYTFPTTQAAAPTVQAGAASTPAAAPAPAAPEHDFGDISHELAQQKDPIVGTPRVWSVTPDGTVFLTPPVPGVALHAPDGVLPPAAYFAGAGQPRVWTLTGPLQPNFTPFEALPGRSTTTRTLNQVRGTRGPNLRGSSASDHIAERSGGQREVTLVFPDGSTRRSDVIVLTTAGGVNYEVKNYLRYRGTIGGPREVGLTPFIQTEINRDALLPSVHLQQPVYLFTDAPPSQAFVDYLASRGIPWLVLSDRLPTR